MQKNNSFSYLHFDFKQLQTNANQIVTQNLKDFPPETLRKYGLTAKGPDDFLTDIIDLNPEKAAEALKEMVLHKRNPDLSEYEVLDIIRERGLKNTADYIHTLL